MLSCGVVSMILVLAIFVNLRLVTDRHDDSITSIARVVKMPLYYCTDICCFAKPIKFIGRLGGMFPRVCADDQNYSLLVRYCSSETHISESWLTFMSL